VPIGEASRRTMLTLITDLRRAGIAADMAFGERGMKGSMKAADRSGASYALLIGEREQAQRAVLIKNLEDGDQVEVPVADAVAWITGRVPGKVAGR
jgi:histidyl-tRNA synthetase